MSRYVSSTLAHRRNRARQNAIAMRIALGILLVMLGVGSGLISWLFLGHTEAIAAYTRDPESLIAQLGIVGGLLSFMCWCALPFVALGLHE